MKTKASDKIIEKNKNRFSRLIKPQKPLASKPLYTKKEISKSDSNKKIASKRLKNTVKFDVDINLRRSIKISVAFVFMLAALYFGLNWTYSGQDLSLKADRYYEKDDYLNAAKYYNKAIDLHFSNTVLYRKYALALTKLGNYDLAYETLQIASSQSPQNPDILYAIANALYLKGRQSGDLELFDQAAIYLQEVITLSPKMKEAFLLIGLCYRGAGKYQEARLWYNKALTAKMSKAEFNNLLGLTSIDEKKYSDAIVYYRRAVEADPSYFLSYINIGDAYDKLNDMNSAVSNYKKAIELDPDFLDSYIQLGNIYFQRQRYDEAVQCYLEALKIHSDNINANFSVGLAYKKGGRFSEAVQYLKKAAYLGSDEAVGELREMGVDLS